MILSLERRMVQLWMFIIPFIARSQSSKVFDEDVHIHLNFSGSKEGAKNRFQSSVQNRWGRTTAPECIEKGFNYLGNTLTEVKTATAEVCACSCKDDQRCGWFTWSPTDYTCRLKYSDRGRRRTWKEFYSGSRDCCVKGYQPENIFSSPVCACGHSPVAHEISGGYEAKPHQYPWIVRLIRGCSNQYCAGSLVSPRVVLSAYHCEVGEGDSIELCDHSDEQRLAIIGAHRIENAWHYPDKYNTIPVIKAFAPPNAWLGGYDFTSHDFALLLLKYPVKYNSKVGPICLPPPNAEYGGKLVEAAGWGRYKAKRRGDFTSGQSPVLRAVMLNVSTENYKNKKIFGTVVKRRSGDNQYMDPCTGDSGGPLMSYYRPTSRYVLIGTVFGQGYNCQHDMVLDFPVDRKRKSTDGIWNKVSAHMEWIQKKMAELGEKGCNRNGNVI